MMQLDMQKWRYSKARVVHYISRLPLKVFAPETVILRFGALIGKILELAADYLPNKSIRGDELLFSFPVIAAAGFLLSRSALPLIQAQFVALDERDLT